MAVETNLPGVTSRGVGVPLNLDCYPDAFRAATEQAVHDILGASAGPAAPDRESPTAGSTPLPHTAPALMTICALPQSGKDVIADHAQATYAGVARMNFSDAIIAEANAWLAGHGRRIGEHNKNEPHNRRLLQQWGHGRRLESRTYWLGPLSERISQLQSSGARMVIVAGARLAIMPVTNEVNLLDLELICALGGETWKVQRPGNPYEAGNPVEDGLLYTPDDVFDCVVLNDREGDLDHFHRNIDAALRRPDRRRTLDPATLALVADGYEPAR